MPTFPPAMNIGDLPIAVPSVMFREPKEGRKSITQSIAWSRPMAAGMRAVNINMQNNATLEFSQICGLIVDNSECGTDLDFVFPDTNVVISIPAYAPYTVLDVLTNQTQFFVIAKAPLTVDYTSFSILNFAPPPVAVPITRQQLTASIGSIAVTGAGTTQIIPATVSGTLQGLNITFACPTPAVSFNDAFNLVDGASNRLWTGNVAQQNSGSGVNIVLVDNSGLSLRFSGGLTLTQTGGFTPGATLDVNAYYLTP